MTYDEIVIGLAINLNSWCYKMVIKSIVVFVKPVILIEIDFNKIAKKALEMIRFYNSSNS